MRSCPLVSEVGKVELGSTCRAKGSPTEGPECQRLTVWAVLLIFLLTVESFTCAVRYLETRADLELVTIDESTGHVFAAGTNFVFKFERFLSHLRNSTKTGPVGACKVPAGECNGASSFNNEARILEKISNSNSILFCGSVRNGLCSLIDMERLIVLELNSTNGLNYAGGKESVCAFFSKNSSGDVLYVANSFDGRPQNVSANAISARRLSKERAETSLFDFNYNFEDRDRNTRSAVEINQSQRSKYVIRYISGFEHMGFTYFVTVQRESLMPESLYQTKLVRVCQQDPGFFSYTEIILTCRKSGLLAEFYNIALAAYVSEPGSELQQRLQLRQGEAVLYVMFGRSNVDDFGAAASPDHGSGLCAYKMSDVRKKFSKDQEYCYRGYGELLPWINPNPNKSKCEVNMNIAKEINENFCGTSVNVGVAGRYPLQTNTSFKTESYLATSLRTLTILNKTVAVIGTTSGHILQVVVDGTDSAHYAAIDVGAGSAIRPDMELDSTEENIYVLSGKRISMVPLKTCSIYSECSSCITTKDPMNCGWCDDHCSTKKECISDWLSGHCPPVILSFLPQTGPIEGGTVVTIHGKNFGNGTLSESVANVKVASSFDCLIEFRNSSCIVCKTTPVSSPLDRELRVSVTDLSKTTVDFKIRGTSNSNDESFSYKVASVQNMFPVIGPASGGTNLTIEGSNLDIGSNLTVTVVGKACLITRVLPTLILCVTSPLNQTIMGWQNSANASRGFVDVTIDNAVLTRGHFQYAYTDDPVIFSIFPNSSILSGGMNLTIAGKNMNSVSHPRIFVNLVDEETKYSDKCHSSSDGLWMVCQSPDLSNASMKLLSLERIDAEVRFVMDGVKELWDFPKTQPDLSLLSYTINPDIFPHPENESVELVETNHLILRLQGLNLNLSASEADYLVTIGGQPCNVTKLTKSELICWQGSFLSAQQREILVRVGNLHFFPGHLRMRDEQSFQEQLSSLGMTILLSILASTVCFIICLLCLRVWRQTQSKRKHQTVPNVLYSGGSQMELPANRVNETAPWLNPIPNSYLSHSEALQHRLTRQAGHLTREPILDEESRRLLTDSNLLISRDRLLLLDIIGQGHFGCVFRGFLKIGVKGEMEVAVKTLKSLPVTDCVYMSPTESRKFVAEALTMREFDHIHVLKLIGIVIDKEELPLVVLPFIRHGDLLSYIRNESNSPTVRDLMEFGMQIADGMNYLANLKFVHRDLAARNCMLDDDMLVKVADFGLSRDIYEHDYYSSDDRKAKLPVKWMALESLEKGIYSTKTDIWSFGVVLWELLTRGVSPYPEVDNWDIVRYLKTGRRMPQPSFCPNSLYNIMLNCWNPDHTMRPTFEELAKVIRNIIEKMEGDQHTVGLNVTYINADVQYQDYLRPLDSRYPEAAASNYRNHTLNYLSVASSHSTLV